MSDRQDSFTGPKRDKQEDPATPDSATGLFANPTPGPLSAGSSTSHEPRSAPRETPPVGSIPPVQEVVFRSSTLPARQFDEPQPEGSITQLFRSLTPDVRESAAVRNPPATARDRDPDARADSFTEVTRLMNSFTEEPRIPPRSLEPGESSRPDDSVRAGEVTGFFGPALTRNEPPTRNEGDSLPSDQIEPFPLHAHSDWDDQRETKLFEARHERSDTADLRAINRPLAPRPVGDAGKLQTDGYTQWVRRLNYEEVSGSPEQPTVRHRGTVPTPEPIKADPSRVTPEPAAVIRPMKPFAPQESTQIQPATIPTPQAPTPSSRLGPLQVYVPLLLLLILFLQIILLFVVLFALRR